METLLFTLLRMCLTAALLTLVVVLLRLAFQKAPKWIMVALWGLVALRLLCPIVPESTVSLMPQPSKVEQYIGAPNTLDLPFAPPPPVETPLQASEANPLPLTEIAVVVWLVGAVGMLLYSTVSYGRLRYRLRGMVPQGERVWLSDHAETPFVLGIVRPRIIVPSSLAAEDKERVLAHERAHIRRLDHVWKPLGFVLLTFHWFNPLLWVAYILLCRDIEMACDERVVRAYSLDEKKAYSSALIQCSVSHRSVRMCPLAFGETAVKSRIRAVLHYKKPTLWILIATAVVIAAVCVFFMTDPVAPAPPTKEQAQAVCATFEHAYHGATCTEQGVCLRCGGVGDCLPHAFASATCLEGEVCNDCGAFGAAALGHDIVGTTCVEKGACSRCGLEGELLPHNFTKATCTEDGVCTQCGAIGESAYGHNYTDATFLVPKTCVNCGATDGEPLELHVHSPSFCDEEGNVYCTQCGELLPNRAHMWYMGRCVWCGLTDPDFKSPYMSNNTSASSVWGNANAGGSSSPLPSVPSTEPSLPRAPYPSMPSSRFAGSIW